MSTTPNTAPVEVLTTDHGTLYHGDAVDLMATLEPGSLDVVFADPPFNLNKEYGAHINDALDPGDYLQWCYTWVDQCIDLLADGGALWLYNLPSWNIPIGAHIMNDPRMTFRHQVAVSMKSSFPIANKLYPAHYSLLYFVKGKRPKTFTKLRTPFETCRHCGGEIKDYGGHRNKMNPDGVNLTDVWTDLSPVRHRSTKYRQANALPEKMLERVLQISSNEGDTVFDPFGGSGTTYAVADRLHRKWIGVEVGDTAPIIARLLGEEASPDAMPGLGANANHRGERGKVAVAVGSSRPDSEAALF